MCVFVYGCTLHAACLTALPHFKKSECPPCKLLMHSSYSGQFAVLCRSTTAYVLCSSHGGQFAVLCSLSAAYFCTARVATVFQKSKHTHFHTHTHTYTYTKHAHTHIHTNTHARACVRNFQGSNGLGPVLGGGLPSPLRKSNNSKDPILRSFTGPLATSSQNRCVCVCVCVVNQYHVYTVYIRLPYFWQGHHCIYGHTWCIHTF